MNIQRFNICHLRNRAVVKSKFEVILRSMSMIRIEQNEIGFMYVKQQFISIEP